MPVIRTVVVGGGMVGLTLARLLRARGRDPIVLERAPAGVYGARGFMLDGFPRTVGHIDHDDHTVSWPTLCPTMEGNNFVLVMHVVHRNILTTETPRLAGQIAP